MSDETVRSTMACWKRVREIVLRRDWFRCQICGDRPGDPHTKLQVHHILERARGGSHDPGNLVTLCDLCHAVAHEHMGPAWCGLARKQTGARPARSAVDLEPARGEFCAYLRLPYEYRLQVRDALWHDLGIEPAALTGPLS